MKEEKKVRKKKQNKENTAVFKLWYMNITKTKVFDSVFKNHKPISINIGNYRDISVQIRPLFAHFRPVKFWSLDRPPPN